MEKKRQNKRCQHGFISDYCVIETCPHWDGIKSTDWKSIETRAPQSRQVRSRQRRQGVSP